MDVLDGRDEIEGTIRGPGRHEKISFMVPFASAPVPPGLQSWLCGAQDPDHHLCQGTVSTTSQALTRVSILDDTCHKDIKVVPGSVFGGPSWTQVVPVGPTWSHLILTSPR